MNEGLMNAWSDGGLMNEWMRVGWMNEFNEWMNDQMGV